MYASGGGGSCSAMGKRARESEIVRAGRKEKTDGRKGASGRAHLQWQALLEGAPVVYLTSGRRSDGAGEHTRRRLGIEERSAVVGRAWK